MLAGVKSTCFYCFFYFTIIEIIPNEHHVGNNLETPIIEFTLVTCYEFPWYYNVYIVKTDIDITLSWSKYKSSYRKVHEIYFF